MSSGGVFLLISYIRLFGSFVVIFGYFYVGMEVTLNEANTLIKAFCGSLLWLRVVGVVGSRNMIPLRGRGCDGAG